MRSLVFSEEVYWTVLRLRSLHLMIYGGPTCLFLTSITSSGDISWLPSDIDQITTSCSAIKFDTVRPPAPSYLSSFYQREAAPRNLSLSHWLDQCLSLLLALLRGFSAAYKNYPENDIGMEDTEVEILLFYF